MTERQARRLLTVNTGSSSLKAGLYEMAPTAQLRVTAQIERIGRALGRIVIADERGATLLDEERAVSDHESALRAFLGWLEDRTPDDRVQAVGHRVVHGGNRYSAPQLVDAALLAALRDMVPIDPVHLPQAVAAIEAVGRAYPAVPQVACFDTAFHRSMPRVAQLLPLPRRLLDAGLARFGFHGLSCESILGVLRAMGAAAADGRVIIAHLGNGASLTAVRGGRSVDTTMGFTPTGGLMMGTRSGDLDPGALLYLLQQQGLSPAAVNDVVNRQAGLLGVSGSSEDMRDLLAREAADPRAAEAVALFCYQARKFLGALVAVLGGLDTLVFTGGIGEHAAPIRWRICAGLEFLGVHLDEQKNAAHAAVISREGSPATVRVIPTDEDGTIALHTARLVWPEGDA